MKINVKRTILIAGAIAVVGVIGLIVIRRVVETVSPLPDDLGHTKGTLAPCPATPNCVSSQAEDAEHRIEPIAFNGSAAEAKMRLLALLQSRPRTRILADRPGYLHAETRSPTLGFIDDNEFYFDEAAQLIQVRAAARLGREDFEANRNRIEQIRTALER